MMKQFISLILFLLLTPAYACAACYVSLCPATTEILFALGAGAEVKGVSKYCNYPPEVRSRQIVGDFSQPNMEKILALKPDIVFCTGLEQSPSIGLLRRHGLSVCVSDPRNLGELYASIEEIGAAVGRKNEAQAMITAMCSSVRRAQEIARRHTTRPKIFFEIWHDPLMTAGKGSFIDELIAIAGGINICSATPRPFSRVSEETVLQANPDVIILPPAIPTDRVKKRFCWDTLAAVHANRVYNDIDEDLLLRPSPRLVEGLAQLQERIFR